MRKKIAIWLESLREVDRVRKLADEAERLAATEPVPKNLRRAEPRDIIEGAIIWYPEYFDISDELYPCAGWKLVSEVRNPTCEFKAYTCHDGCRYGLSGAFVEI